MKFVKFVTYIILSSRMPSVVLEINLLIYVDNNNRLLMCMLTFLYSGTSPYGHLTSKKTSQLQSPWLSPKLYSRVQITPSNKVTSPLSSLLPSPVGDRNSEVLLYLENIQLTV